MTKPKDKPRVPAKVVRSLAKYEPITLVLDVLEALDFDFVVGLDPRDGSTIVTMSSKGGKTNKVLRKYLRQDLAEHARTQREGES